MTTPNCRYADIGATATRPRSSTTPTAWSSTTASILTTPHPTPTWPAIARLVARFGRPPALLTADRGYWEPTIEADLHTAGVTDVVIPRTGKPSQARMAVERADPFVAALKWRTGCEGRISPTSNETGTGGAPG
jgi:IS5 family transposase